jgi:Resolvase, N terminal domain
MLKVALYARYSTDNQSVASIEDQFRVCHEHAGKERWQVINTYQDAAISAPASFSDRVSNRCCRTPSVAGSTSYWPKRWTASRAIRPTWRHCSSISVSPACRLSPWQKAKSPNFTSALKAR